MVIKIKKKSRIGEKVRYKSTKKILTPRDIKDADDFDNALSAEIVEIEKVLVERNLLTPEARKHNMLHAWHLIGSRINKFLEQHKVSSSEERLFWDNLYERFSVVEKAGPIHKISQTRNDFRIASLLAHHPLEKLDRIGLWALWREIITYKALQDKRVLNWVIQSFERNPPKTRNAGRPLLKAVALRLKKIDTSVLKDTELIAKLNEVTTN
jgi:hypothetical protein